MADHYKLVMYFPCTHFHVSTISVQPKYKPTVKPINKVLLIDTIEYYTIMNVKHY